MGNKNTLHPSQGSNILWQETVNPMIKMVQQTDTASVVTTRLTYYEPMGWTSRVVMLRAWWIG